MATAKEDGGTSSRKKQCKAFTWCIFICSLAAILFIFYEYHFSRSNGSKDLIITSMDKDHLKVVNTFVEKFREEAKEYSKDSSLWKKMSAMVKTESNDQYKLVLLYTGFFGHFPWGWLRDTTALNQWDGMTCPHYHCTLTYDKKDFKKADAVIFHAQDMVSRSELNALQLSRTANQRWIFFPTESPQNVPESHMINGLFNWTMSYRRDSDIFRPYGYFYPRSKKRTTEEKDAFLEYLESKDLLVVWLCSHAGALRDKYVRRLRTFIKIYVYGKTGARVGGISGKCLQDSPDCKKHLKRFKFLLAFENSFCTDYVTEKYWFCLEMGIVPVVMGGAEYDKIAIPGSYINVKDFPTIKALADYLQHLDLNDKEYNKYFEWKEKYKVVIDAPWTCQLCARLNIDHKKKVYNGLEYYWGAAQQCGIKEDVIKKIIAKQPWGKTSMSS
ncbi:alpha-(1,3)-fucosyltransferase 6-like [Actinia tenebrosa]|uniref:Fucosyltransferase n=1 Tax=Actinia tenebrosa TaxID=6105 RepID=A0A6P8H5X0_ACTTE|nr:alpha-(1,3)-fucosyltransferase 6-like [Actinia tenebrosa]